MPLTEAKQGDCNGIVAGLSGYPVLDVPAIFPAPTATAPLGVPVGLDLLGGPSAKGGCSA